MRILKMCSKCRGSYPRTALFFYKDAQKKDGFRPDCKVCCNIVVHKYNRTKIGKLVHNKANARYKKTTQGKFINWKYRLKRKYNLTPDDYNKLSKNQKHLCAICGEHETATWKGLAKILCVDHDHKTGKVRGLLCSRCNRALGLFEDSMVLLTKVIKYLKRR